jgi:hypothetical protein
MPWHKGRWGKHFGRFHVSHRRRIPINRFSLGGDQKGTRAPGSVINIWTDSRTIISATSVACGNYCHNPWLNYLASCGLVTKESKSCQLVIDNANTRY